MCIDPTTWPEIIAAIGAVISSCLTLYLVHRRIMADRETRIHRADEGRLQGAVVEKLGVDVAAIAERDANRT